MAAEAGCGAEEIGGFPASGVVSCFPLLPAPAAALSAMPAGRRSLALLLLGLLVLLGLAVADEYGMMYDAGSSETRLWLFTWPERTNTSSAPAVTNVVSISTNASASFSFSPRM